MVLRRLPFVCRPSLGYGPTRSLSLLCLFGLFLGVLLSALPPFSPSGLLSAHPFVLSTGPLGFSFLLVVCTAFSPRLVSPGAPQLWHPSVVWGALPRVVLVLWLRNASVRLPSFLPLLLLRCLAAWWLFFPLGKLLYYVRLGLLIRRWFPWVCVLCCLSPVSLTPPV